MSEAKVGHPEGGSGPKSCRPLGGSIDAAVALWMVPEAIPTGLRQRVRVVECLQDQW